MEPVAFTGFTRKLRSNDCCAFYGRLPIPQAASSLAALFSKECRHAPKYLFPAVAFAIVIFGLMAYSFYTAGTIDGAQRTTTAPTSGENQSVTVPATGEKMTSGDDGKPPAPENRPQPKFVTIAAMTEHATISATRLCQAWRRRRPNAESLNFAAV